MSNEIDVPIPVEETRAVVAREQARANRLLLWALACGLAASWVRVGAVLDGFSTGAALDVLVAVLLAAGAVLAANGIYVSAKAENSRPVEDQQES